MLARAKITKSADQVIAYQRRHRSQHAIFATLDKQASGLFPSACAPPPHMTCTPALLKPTKLPQNSGIPAIPSLSTPAVISSFGVGSVNHSASTPVIQAATTAITAVNSGALSPLCSSWLHQKQIQ